MNWSQLLRKEKLYYQEVINFLNLRIFIKKIILGSNINQSSGCNPLTSCCFASEETIVLKLKVMTHLEEKNDEKFTLIGKVYEEMIAEDKLKNLLSYVQMKKNYKIIFKESKGFIEDLKLVQHNNQYSENQIFIECKGLFESSRINDLHGIIARRLCNFAMFTYFENEGKPYRIEDEGNQTSNQATFVEVSNKSFLTYKEERDKQKYFKISHCQI